MTESNSGGVAVVGAGYWGRNLVRNFHAIGELAAICDDRPAVRIEMGSAFPGVALHANFKETLGDPSIRAVAIATPAETHATLARMALDAGKDVYVEKPLCLSVDDGEALAALASKSGRILMVGHLLWYHPAVILLKEMVSGGDLGRIRYIYSHRLNLGKVRREENVLWSFAPHDISVILGLLQATPQTVVAQAGTWLTPGVADSVDVLLAFPDGVKARVFVTWLHPFKEQKLVVVGDRAMAVFDDQEPKDKLRIWDHQVDTSGPVPVPRRAEARAVALPSGEPLRTECEHFVSCVRTRSTPRTDAAEGIRVLRVLRACEESMVAQRETQKGTMPA